MKPLLLSTLLFAAPVLAQDATPALAPMPAPEPTTAPTDSTDSPATNAPDDEKVVEKVIVITAERNRQPLAASPSAVAVITREQIEAKKPFDLLDVLRLAPGISVAQSGTRGKSASVFTRGTNSNQTLVLVDGVRANSPQDGRFDFGQIPALNVERVEVVRGPASALYGSDAIGGVINIITRRGSGPLQPGGLLEFGNRGINRQEISARGSFGERDENRLSFSGYRLDSGGQFRNDDYRNLGTSLRFDRDLSPNKTLSFIGRTSESKFGVPGQRFLSFDPFQRDNARDTQLSLQFENRDRKRRDKIIVGQTNRRLEDDDTRDPGAPTAAPSRFSNRVQSFDAQTSYDLGRNLLTAGIEARRESADISSNFAFADQSGALQTGGSRYNRTTRTDAAFAQDEFKSGKWTLAPGARYEDNSQFGHFTSYRVAGAFDATSRTRLKASYGTAFKAPSFDSLYFPNFGNPNLNPETSRGYDAGVLQELPRGGTLEVTYYNNRIKDLIGSDPQTFLPVNINRARTHGFEVALDQPLGREFRLILNGNTTNTSSSTGPLLRRPRFNASADLLANRGKFGADLGLVAQGERFDSNFVNEFTPRKYGGTVRTDFTLSYQFGPQGSVYARVGNLFNRKTEEVAGYPAPRFNLSFGIKTLSF